MADEEHACEDCGEPMPEERILVRKIIDVLNGSHVQTGAFALVHALAMLITSHASRPADMKLMRDDCVSLLFEKTEHYIEQAWNDPPDEDQVEASGETPTVLN